MDFVHLSHFVSVAQTLNFSEAARRMSVPQPNISRSINDLEKHFGFKLFSRTTRDVVLTKEGEAFLPYALDIIDTIDRASNFVENVHSGFSGHISIATISTSSNTLTACLSRFSKKYPDVFVDVTYNTGREQTLALGKNKFDAYFSPLAMLPDDYSLDYIITEWDRLALVVPKGHPITRSPDDFSLLKNERFLITSEAASPLMYSQIINVCSARELTPKIISRHEKAESIILSVGAGLGVSILPFSLTQVFKFDTFDVIPIKGEDAVRPYVFAWKKNSPNSSSVLFSEIVNEYVRNNSTVNNAD